MEPISGCFHIGLSLPLAEIDREGALPRTLAGRRHFHVRDNLWRYAPCPSVAAHTHSVYSCRVGSRNLAISLLGISDQRPVLRMMPRCVMFDSPLAVILGSENAGKSRLRVDFLLFPVWVTQKTDWMMVGEPVKCHGKMVGVLGE